MEVGFKKDAQRMCGLAFCLRNAAIALIMIAIGLPLMAQSLAGGVLSQWVTVPRMMEAERQALAPAHPHSLVYQIDGEQGYYFHNSKSWVFAGADRPAAPSRSAQGGYLFEGTAGALMDVKAADANTVKVNATSIGVHYVFQPWVNVLPDRAERVAMRIKSIYPNLLELKFEGKMAFAKFDPAAPSAEVENFFQQLGCNVFQPKL